MSNLLDRLDNRDKRILFALFIFLLAVTFLLQALPDSGKSIIRYDRAAILSGEWWRLFSGHFLHLGWMHLFLNLAGLGMILVLFWRYWTTKNFIQVFLFSLIAVCIGLWWLATDVRWYVGLSGVLHGLLIAGAILSFSAERWFSLIMIAITCGKLAWEQITRSSAGTAELIGGKVLFDAHLYGFTGGLFSVIVLILIHGRKQS